MSIQGEIDRIKANVSDTYAAVAEKGGVLPEEQNSDNLAAAVQSIAGAGGGEDYSVEESVIGTWTDGTPLYRRTFIFEKHLISGHGDGYVDYCTDIDVYDIDVKKIEGTISPLYSSSYYSLPVVYEKDHEFYYFYICVEHSHLTFMYKHPESEDVLVSITLTYTKESDH